MKDRSRPPRRGRQENKAATKGARTIVAAPSAEIALARLAAGRFTPLQQQMARRLQRQVGNRAVGRLLQRDEEPAGSDQELDPEIATLLDQIIAFTPPPPPIEVITSTTSAEFSQGELEQDIMRLWQREQLSFTDAARAHADRDDGRGARAVSSPHIDPDSAYAQRWMLHLAAEDYESIRDLPEIGRLLQAGSPFFQSEAAEFDEVRAAKNPTGDDILNQTYRAVIDLGLALPVGQMGELVVFFSGHGGGGSIVGVDGVSIGVSALNELGNFANENGVHLFYMLDTCRAGNMVGFAQANILSQTRGQIAGAPASQQAGLTESFQFAGRLFNFAAHISNNTLPLGDAIRAFSRRQNRGTRQAYRAQLTQMRQLVEDVHTFTQDDAFANGDVPGRSELTQNLRRLRLTLRRARGLDAGQSRSVLRRLALFLDSLGQTLNDLITRFQSDVQASQAPPDATNGA